MKQIMFTPETENEREALKLITADDDIHTIVEKGSFYDGEKVFGVNIYTCQGGYMRAKQDEDSVMLVLTPKKKAL